MNKYNLQKVGGLSAVLEGLIYIMAFVIYGAIIVYPSSGASASERLVFLTENQLLFSTASFIGYILFGILLVPLVLAIYHRLKSYSPYLAQITSVFGFIWSVLVIASGMIEMIGLASVIKMGAKDVENAMLVFSSMSIITEGIGGGNEIVGGLWVLLLSFTAQKAGIFSKALNFFGIFIGLVGILTTYPLDLFTEIFGISQIVWFIWLGISMMRRPLEE